MAYQKLNNGDVRRALRGLFSLAFLFAVADANSGDMPFASSFEDCESVGCEWAFEETFNGDPGSPSQALLPRTFDYVVTHRTHPKNHNPDFDSFPADHAENCDGPAPPGYPQHQIQTSHSSNGGNPDESFYVCKNHMMSSMGDVEGYSVTAFWPRQAFDFAQGGELEFDVNINDGHPRSWWEILITPADQLKVGAAREWLPIDETYPRDRIVFDFSPNSERSIMVGQDQLAPEGWTNVGSDWRDWSYIVPDDPALADRRIRRTMKIKLQSTRIEWSIEKPDGQFDVFAIDLNQPLPFTRGLVLFKTHAYTPKKDGNNELYTYHWDNIRFSGPVVGQYETFESNDFVYLQANGSRPIGEEAVATIELPKVPLQPRLFGQVHGALNGQVLLSINGGDYQQVDPLEYSEANCSTAGWSSFFATVSPIQLKVGTNEFRWKIGPRPACPPEWVWDGFSVKGLEIQAH